jgi:hypothetical protein
MSILALLDNTLSRPKTTEKDTKTYIYKDPLLPVLRFIGLTGQRVACYKAKANL